MHLISLFTDVLDKCSLQRRTSGRSRVHQHRRQQVLHSHQTCSKLSTLAAKSWLVGSLAWAAAFRSSAITLCFDNPFDFTKPRPLRPSSRPCRIYHCRRRLTLILYRSLCTPRYLTQAGPQSTEMRPDRSRALAQYRYRPQHVASACVIDLDDLCEPKGLIAPRQHVVTR